MCDCYRMCFNTAQQQVKMTDSLFQLRTSHCLFPVHCTGEDTSFFNVNIKHSGQFGRRYTGWKTKGSNWNTIWPNVTWLSPLWASLIFRNEHILYWIFTVWAHNISPSIVSYNILHLTEQITNYDFVIFRALIVVGLKMCSALCRISRASESAGLRVVFKERTWVPRNQKQSPEIHLPVS